MAVKMVSNVKLCTNSFFSRVIDKAYYELGRDGLSFKKNGAPDRKLGKHCSYLVSVQLLHFE